MGFWKFTGTEDEFFPVLGLTARPGEVYDFGDDEPPREPLAKGGQLSPIPASKWVSDAGPATDFNLKQASDVKNIYVALDGGRVRLPPNRTGTGRFDPITGLYVPASITAPLRAWRKALAKARAGTRTAKLACPGDSIAFGQYATPHAFTDGWVARLRAMIDADLGKPAGSGVVWSWITWSGSTWRTDDTRVTYTGVVETFGFGPFEHSCLNLANGASVVFAPGVAVDGFRVYFVKQTDDPTHVMTVQIDSAAATTVSTGGGTQNSVGVTYVAAGGNGVHTLTVSGAVGYNVYLVGVEAVVNDGYGVAVTGVGAPGLTAGYYNAASTDGAASYQFVTNGIAPDLTVLGFGHNEYLNQEAISQQTTEMTEAIQNAQASGSDVLLLTTIPNEATGLTPAQSDVDQLRYTLADSLGCVVLDLANRWGSYAADPSLYANQTHPDNAGYADMAQAVFAAVMR